MNFFRWLYRDLKKTLSNNVGAVNFDGTNDYIDMGSTTDLRTSVFTVSLWVRGNANSGTGSIEQLINQVGNTGTSVTTYSFSWSHTNSSFQQAWAINDGGWHSAKYSTALLADTWYHILATKDNTGGLKIYLNGNLETTDATATSSPLTTSGSFWVGTGWTNNPTNFFPGKVSEVAVWNKVLIQAEIDQLADSKIKGMPLQIQSANLQGYFPLDDHPHNDTADSANGLVFKDQSANSNDGTASGCNAQAEQVLSYPDYYSMIVESGAAPPVGAGIRRPYYKGRW